MLSVVLDTVRVMDSSPDPSPLVYYVAQSLDGFVADRDESLEWLLDFGFEAFQEHYDAFFSRVGAVIMGASTFRWLADSGQAWPYPDLPCWVLSHGDLPEVAGAEDIVVETDPTRVAESARTAAAGRAVWVVGGGVTAAQFADAGQLDELLITIMPITLGAGAPVLPHDASARRWALSGTTPFAGGAIELAYRAIRN